MTEDLTGLFHQLSPFLQKLEAERVALRNTLLLLGTHLGLLAGGLSASILQMSLAIEVLVYSIGLLLLALSLSGKWLYQHLTRPWRTEFQEKIISAVFRSLNPSLKLDPTSHVDNHHAYLAISDSSLCQPSPCLVVLPE